MLARIASGSLAEDPSKLTDENSISPQFGIGGETLFTQLPHLRFGYVLPVFQDRPSLEKLAGPDCLFFFFRLAYEFNAHTPCLRVLLEPLVGKQFQET
jgi:hypothetical protein